MPQVNKKPLHSNKKFSSNKKLRLERTMNSLEKYLEKNSIQKLAKK